MRGTDISGCGQPPRVSGSPARMQLPQQLTSGKVCVVANDCAAQSCPRLTYWLGFLPQLAPEGKWPRAQLAIGGVGTRLLGHLAVRRRPRTDRVSAAIALIICIVGIRWRRSHIRWRAVCALAVQPRLSGDCELCAIALFLCCCAIALNARAWLILRVRSMLLHSWNLSIIQSR